MEDKYISREAVLNLIEHNDKVCHYADERYENIVYATAQTICKVVAEMPAADVQPVKRGRWVHDGSGHDGRDNWYHCSECNRALNLICGKKLEDYPYCHCGARMYGEQDG